MLSKFDSGSNINKGKQQFSHSITNVKNAKIPQSAVNIAGTEVTVITIPIIISVMLSNFDNSFSFSFQLFS